MCCDKCLAIKRTAHCAMLYPWTVCISSGLISTVTAQLTGLWEVTEIPELLCDDGFVWLVFFSCCP